MHACIQTDIYIYIHVFKCRYYRRNYSFPLLGPEMPRIVQRVNGRMKSHGASIPQWLCPSHGIVPSILLEANRSVWQLHQESRKRLFEWVPASLSQDLGEAPANGAAFSKQTPQTSLARRCCYFAHSSDPQELGQDFRVLQELSVAAVWLESLGLAWRCARPLTSERLAAMSIAGLAHRPWLVYLVQAECMSHPLQFVSALQFYPWLNMSLHHNFLSCTNSIPLKKTVPSMIPCQIQFLCQTSLKHEKNEKRTANDN